MSGSGPPRFPNRPRGPFGFGNPRFPPLNPPPRQFSPSFRPRHQENEYFSHRGRSRGFVPSRGHPGPRGRFPTPYGHDRPSFGNRGRGQGYYGNKGFKKSSDQGRGVEAYYKRSMVENPWKELEENFKKQNQKQNEHNS